MPSPLFYHNYHIITIIHHKFAFFHEGKYGLSSDNKTKYMRNMKSNFIEAANQVDLPNALAIAILSNMPMSVITTNPSAIS